MKSDEVALEQFNAAFEDMKRQYELTLKRAAREISQIEKDHAIRYQYMAAASHQRSVEFMADGDLDKAAIFQLHRAHFAKRARWWMRIEP